jgi:hypothetical protein
MYHNSSSRQPIEPPIDAVYHANVTGNYTVLRDLFSPQMRERLKASDFAHAFRNAHDRHRDLSFVMHMKPNLKQRPTFSADNRLRLVGYFPTYPLVLFFDLVFLKTEHGDWWNESIVIHTERAKPRTKPISQP